MPAFNAERYIEEAVDSILAQTFTEFELVAVDDGSTDRTREILDRYGRKDARVAVVSAVGKGFVHALTTGVSAARGAIIARMDADDRSSPDRLQLQWGFLEARPEVGLLGSSVQVIDERGEPLNVIRYPLTDPIIRLTLRHQTAFAHGSVVMRREALLAVGGYRAAAHPADDYELWCRLVANGVKAANIDATLYEYRVNAEGISRSRPADMQRAAREAGEAYGRELRPIPTWTELKAGIRAVAAEVDAGAAAPAALRRVSRSLLASAPLWSRSRPLTGVLCLRGAVAAESSYRRTARGGPDGRTHSRT